MRTAPNNGSKDTLEASAVERDLLRSDAYSHAVAEVGFLQTHISLIFFAGDFVFKVKKPVDLGFLDFTTVEKRKYFCEEELRLNRRMAPNVYIGVVPISIESDGRLRVEGQGQTVEWAVKMRRLPAHRMLSELLKCGEIDNSQMNAMADLLKQFHAGAATGVGVDEHGSPAAIKSNIAENFAQLEPFVGKPDKLDASVLSATQHEFLAKQALDFLETHDVLLESRVRDERIRDGHGDLHAGNICLENSGIVAYDCIEFSPKFRCGDVASDLAFLAMDLDYRGFPAFSKYLVRRYAQVTEDTDLPALTNFYKSYRAVIRGKVAALTASSSSVPPQDREDARLEAMRYLQLAAAYDLPPAMILMCGLPACGKSWLAKKLAKCLRAVVLRSDVRRKQLSGVQSTANTQAAYESGIYASESKRKVYRSIRSDAVDYLNAGRSVIIDATFSREKYRSAFIETAKNANLPYFVVHVTASDTVIRERLEQRITAVNEPSDADLQVYLSEREAFELPTELSASNRIETVSGVAPTEVSVSAIIDVMINAAS